MTGAVRLFVIYDRVRVCMLCVAYYVQAVNPALRALVVHNHTEVVSRESRAQRNIGTVKTAVSSQIAAPNKGRVKRSEAIFAVVNNPTQILTHNFLEAIVTKRLGEVDDDNSRRQSAQ